MAPSGMSLTGRFSILLILVCVGTMLLITACGFLPPARPYVLPDHFVLFEDAAAGTPARVLGHGTLSVQDALLARAELTLYLPSGQLTFPDLRGLVQSGSSPQVTLQGASGRANLSLLVQGAPGPAARSGSRLLPFQGRLKVDLPALPVLSGGSEEHAVRAVLQTEDHLRLELPARSDTGLKPTFSLDLTLWPGDAPGSSHIRAVLYPGAPCQYPVHSDERVSTSLEEPLTLDLSTPRSSKARLELLQSLNALHTGRLGPVGSIRYTEGPCAGQRYTVGGTNP